MSGPLSELEPKFLKHLVEDGKEVYRIVDSLADADGINFLCPKCFQENGGPVGTHHIICWRPHIPQTVTPKPGRWEFQGTGFDDLTLVAGSSSIQLLGGCRWHGFIQNGQWRDA